MDAPKDITEVSVLIVDDNEPTRELVRKLLNNFGVTQVFEASNGFEAFGMLCRNKVHAIICDIKMAPVNGIEFVRKLRSGNIPGNFEGASEVNRNTPVLMLTAHTVKPLVEQAKAVGANAFLAKPISPKLLRERLEMLTLKRPA